MTTITIESHGGTVDSTCPVCSATLYTSELFLDGSRDAIKEIECRHCDAKLHAIFFQCVHLSKAEP